MGTEKCHKIGPRGTKIDYKGIILTDFDMKITFPTSIRVRNLIFDRFLKQKTKQTENSPIFKQIFETSKTEQK